MEEKKKMRTTKTSEYVELDVQNQLEAAFKELIKAREESSLDFEKSMNEAHLDFEKALREMSTEASEANGARSPLDLEREFVNKQFDNRKKHESEFKAARDTYEEKVREVFSSTDLGDADLRTMAEVSRIISCFASVN